MGLISGRAPSRRGRVAVLVAALACAALTARLGLWQWERAAQKEALQASLDLRARWPAVGRADLAAAAHAGEELRDRRVQLRGRWLAERTVYLDNRQMHARPGFIVVTPLQWNGGAVLVQRGWVARDNDERTRLPPLVTPPGEVEVAGRVAPPPARLYEFASAIPGGAIRQNLDPLDYAREIGVALLPVTVLQSDASAADGLLRDWPAPAADTHKHYGYAFQWWALSALTMALYVWYQLLRPRLSRKPRRDDEPD
jgi:surfeit locus 1 family protein